MARLSIDLNAAVVRSLTGEDLALLEEERETKAPPLKRLGERHHALAKCLADGMQGWEAALACSYSPSRVSILQADPTFQGLIKFYRDGVDRRFFSTHEQMAALSRDAMAELQERLEEEPEKMRTDQLIELSKFGTDRTGFGPSQTNVNLHLDGAAKLASARKRVLAYRAEQSSVDQRPKDLELTVNRSEGPDTE